MSNDRFARGLRVAIYARNRHEEKEVAAFFSTESLPKNDGTTGVGSTELRTWTWTYNALGQALTAKDPLNKTTTTVYYPTTDTAVPPKYTMGDVQTVTNAAGHITTFNEYDKNGRLTKMTDAKIKQHLFCNFAKFLSLRDVGVVDKSLVLS